LRARPAGRQCRPVGRVGPLPGRSFCDEDEKLRIEDDTLWDYPNHLMVAAAVNAHQRAPEADAVVQTGAGFRMMQVVDTAEGQIGKPVVASDFALYWAMLRHLGLQAAPGCGHLLSTLES
ncbi:MAG: hypothetical protein GY929_22110, partial [Actinomycetia bacterium]|nr:hypothetical protein [Actinomycetes bacterium]